MELYHGTTLDYFLKKVSGNMFYANNIWVGFNPSYSLRIAKQRAAHYGSLPLLFSFSPTQGMLEPYGDHYLFTGELSLDDLLFHVKNDVSLDVAIQKLSRQYHVPLRIDNPLFSSLYFPSSQHSSLLSSAEKR